MALFRTVGLGALAAAATIIANPTPPAYAGTTTSPLGVWMDNTGRGAIEIKSCGGDTLCGHVVWVRSAKDQSGCGHQIIGAARPVGRKGMYQGWIYSPEKRQRFDVEFVPSSSDKLRVTGYAGIRLFSRTMYWTRAADDLVRCASTQTAKAAPSAPAKVAAKAAAPETKAAEPASERIAKATTEQKPQTPESQNTASSEVAPTPDASPAAKPTADEEDAGDAAAAASEAPASEDQPDEEQVADSGTDAGGSDLSKLNLGGLNVGKVISRKGGTCKLDLPWVKVHFDCKDL